MVSIFNKSSFWHGHWIQCSSHFWVPRLESSILLLKKYPEFLNIPTILGRYHYNIYSMMDFSYQEIYHNLPLKLRQNWMLWDTRICNSWINGWPHFTFIYTVLIYIYTYTPYAPCMEYLPTFTRTKSPSFVGKYTFYEAYGYIYISTDVHEIVGFISSFLSPNPCRTTIPMFDPVSTSSGGAFLPTAKHPLLM